MANRQSQNGKSSLDSTDDFRKRRAFAVLMGTAIVSLAISGIIFFWRLIYGLFFYGEGDITFENSRRWLLYLLILFIVFLLGCLAVSLTKFKKTKFVPWLILLMFVIYVVDFVNRFLPPRKRDLNWALYYLSDIFMGKETLISYQDKFGFTVYVYGTTALFVCAILAFGAAYLGSAKFAAKSQAKARRKYLLR